MREIQRNGGSVAIVTIHGSAVNGRSVRVPIVVVSPWPVGDTVVRSVEKDDEEATHSVATPGVSSQCATFGPSLSRRPGMEPHAAEYLPAPPPRATPPSLLYQRCVGMAAQGRGKARQPNGPERLEGLMVWNAASKLCSGQQTSFALQSQGGPGYEFLTQPLVTDCKDKIL